MNFENIIQVLKLLGFEFSLLEENEKVGRIVVDISFDDYYDEWTQKIIYYNKETDYIIPNYEEKLKVKKEIKELKQRLAKLEQQEKELTD